MTFSFCKLHSTEEQVSFEQIKNRGSTGSLSCKNSMKFSVRNNFQPLWNLLSPRNNKSSLVMYKLRRSIGYSLTRITRIKITKERKTADLKLEAYMNTRLTSSCLYQGCEKQRSKTRGSVYGLSHEISQVGMRLLNLNLITLTLPTYSNAR